MTCTEVVVMVKELIVAIAAATTAVVAIVGLQSWRRELKGKAEYDVARDLITATYRLREALRQFRSPLIWAQEFPKESTIDDQSDDAAAKALGHVYGNRWVPVTDALTQFDAASLASETLWGNPVRERTDAMRQLIGEVNAAAMATIEDRAEGGADFRADPEFGKKMRQTLTWAPKEEANEMSQRIFAAIRNIEGGVRQHLRRE